ncbi:phosphoglycerate dehydrogenase [Asticcacaulis sp. YBE204]|uniref:phosphoglycerate dehydrogenase n=1 Tax=Asticcacaulis sp. YBE204 TaxID=1282363 RepID=UPI0003C3F783|nr:phosphoglycerate dehydrogenase [Asticcacaulis sp. YBE204]ESQ81150.1 3-phosphoglycerate dehydrogenase [Asticcacaulis sp. YBE204]
MHMAPSSANLATLVLDFDSTFTKVEALDVLAEQLFSSDPARLTDLNAIKELTELAMSGEIGFGEALQKRIQILKPSREDIAGLAETLKQQVSDSIGRNLKVFQEHPGKIRIISGGFHEFIEPVVADYGIKAEHVLANRLIFDDNGIATGVEQDNPLSKDGGKIIALQSWAVSGQVVMIGDGWTDFEVFKGGGADRFYAFVENISREKVVAATTGNEATQVAASFDEVLHNEGYEGRYSFPRSRMKMLMLENVHPVAIAHFREEGYDVSTLKGALDEDALIEAIQGVHVLGIRSKTNVTAKVLDAADKLMAIGAFCIGTNQIDLKAASAKGVAVFNAPYSNTRSVVEMVMGLTVVLTRNIYNKSIQMHTGKWDKSATGAHEVRNKTIGIIGYGAIGSQLSVLAEAFGMRVIYYDVAEKLTMGNAKRYRSLDALLAEADVVSLHVDGRAENKNIFGRAQFAKMKDGALFINLSRGHVVDIEALAEAIRSKKIYGAGVDVFPEEPRTNDDPFDSPLMGLDNVILSPHIGGSTEEAQEAIGEFASERLLNFISRGDTTFSVNMPNVQLSEVEGRHRFLHIHKNVPGVMASINQIMAKYNLNILAQHLKTNEQLGYVIVDVDRGYSKEALDELRAVNGTLKFRSLV